MSWHDSQVFYGKVDPQTLVVDAVQVSERNHLQRGLGTSLSATVAFDNPTLPELVDHSPVSSCDWPPRSR